MRRKIKLIISTYGESDVEKELEYKWLWRISICVFACASVISLRNIFFLYKEIDSSDHDAVFRFMRKCFVFRWF